MNYNFSFDVLRNLYLIVQNVSIFVTDHLNIMKIGWTYVNSKKYLISFELTWKKEKKKQSKYASNTKQI